MSISIRTIATFAIAIFLGIVAVILTRNYLGSATQVSVAQPAAAGSVPVVVAAQPLDRGVVLQPNFLKIVNLPTDSVPVGAFRSIADLTGGKDQQRLALRSLAQNEPILAPNVSGPGGKLNLSGTIAPGMRGVSLRSTDVTGVGGFVLPGDRVDVLLTRVTGSGNDANTTLVQVLAENVRVLGVDQSDNDQADKPVVSKAITVEVTPDQAQSISLGQTVGTVSLTLRHVADDTPLTHKSMSVKDLATGPRKVAAAAPPPGVAVRVVRGTDTARFTMGVTGAMESVAAKAQAGVQNAMMFASNRFKIWTAAILFTGSLFACADASFAADTSTAAPAPAEPITLGVGKSKLVELPSGYSDVMIGDPKIADVLPLNAHSVYVVGKGMGSTSLMVYAAGKRLIYTSDVLVSADLESFKARLHEILPQETNISVTTANQSIVLSGTATSPALLQQILSLADTYDPGKVVNMMSVQGTQQVMLSVRFVEMERTTAKNLRLNVQQTPTTSNPVVAVTTGDTLINTAQSALTSFGQAALTWSAGGGDLSFLFDALETKGLVKTLAEPNLVAMSGDTANFLAGGEFPIPVQQSNSLGGTSPTITIEYKQFGISLAFTPTILQDGMVNMVVNPEVSSIDPTTSVQLGSISVPGIKVRRAHTTVELRDGESFTIAGLLSDNYQNNIRQFPFLGDLPVLGTLFRSTGFQQDQTELVMVVTPHLVAPRRGPVATPADSFVPPSDFELFLFGNQRGKAENLKPEDRALMSADPAKGGIDGAYGHVLY